MTIDKKEFIENMKEYLDVNFLSNEEYFIASVIFEEFNQSKLTLDDKKPADNAHSLLLLFFAFDCYQMILKHEIVDEFGLLEQCDFLFAHQYHKVSLAGIFHIYIDVPLRSIRITLV
jgi:hypothetical protein